MNRREFFAVGTGLSFGIDILPAWGAKIALETDKRDSAKLRISSQVGAAPGKTLEEKLEKMKLYGCEAVEYGGECLGKGKVYRQKAENAGLNVSVICGGLRKWNPCIEDVEKRQPGIDALKKALETAGEMGAQGVIYVPAFNGQTKLTNQEIRALLLDFMPDLAKFANDCKTNIILEPLCRMEAYFLRQVADGASIARDVLKLAGLESGIGVMSDFYHMDAEETSQMGAFISGGSYLRHVHLAGGVENPRRTFPGENNMTFVDGFRGLKYIGYQGYCSFECGCANSDREAAFKQSIEFLRSQWDEA